MPNTEIVVESDTAALFDPRSEEVLSSPERALLATLLSHSGRVDLALPDGISAASLWESFQVCGTVFKITRRASGQLKLLIGRALKVMQDTPESYESRGFRSFDDFMTRTDGLERFTGISRAEGYKAKSVAESAGPDMSLADARDVGFTKMCLVTGVAKSTDSNFQSLMDHAKTDTIPQLRQRIERAGLIDADETVWDVLTIPVTLAQKRFWTAFVQNPQVQAYCESQSAGMILERAVSEVMSEWSIEQPVTDGEAAEA